MPIRPSSPRPPAGAHATCCSCARTQLAVYPFLVPMYCLHCIVGLCSVCVSVCVCVCVCVHLRAYLVGRLSHLCAPCWQRTPRRAPRGGSRIVYTAFLYQATTGSCKKSTYFTSCVHSRHQSSNTHVRRVYCFTGIQLYRHTALQVHEENVEFHYGLRPLARPIRGSDPFDAHRSTRNPNRPSSAPRAYSPCRIALYPGRAPFWPPRGARRNLRMRYRLIRAVAKRRAHQSCIDTAF